MREGGRREGEGGRRREKEGGRRRIGQNSELGTYLVGWNRRGVGPTGGEAG